MVARCLVGGCSWNAEANGAVELEVAVEAHRREFHTWVAVGKLHRLELNEPGVTVIVEPVQVERPPTVRVALRSGPATAKDWL